MKKIHPIRKILPSILAFITGRERYLPRDIEWVDNLWTHNIFRAFELVFWRAFGPNGVGDTIRAESAVQAEIGKDGKIYVRREFYTLEAITAHVEGMIRQKIENAVKVLKGEEAPHTFLPAPAFAMAAIVIFGIEIKLSGGSAFAPLVAGAIAYDNSNKGIVNSSSLTFSLTTSGSNRLLIIGGQLQDSTRSWSSITYAGNATTQIGSNIIYSANNAPGQMRYQIAPTTGANNAVFTPSGSIQIRGIAVNYTGCDQASQIDATAQTSGGSSFNVNVVAANCWMVCQCVGFNNDFDTPGPSYVTPAGVLTTIRQFYDDGMAITDSNGTVSTGNQAVQMSGLNSNNGIIAASIKPLANTEYNQSITATASISASVIKQVPKTIIATSTITGNVFKGLSKTLIANATATASMVKQMSKSLIAEVAVSASMVATKVYLQALTATANVSAAITKIPGKLLTATSTVSASIDKTFSITKILTATASITADIRKGLSKTLIATTNVSGSITKIPAKILTATTNVSASISSGLAKVLVATANVSASIVAGRAVIMIATANVAATITKTPHKLLTVVATIVAKIRAPFYRTKYPAHGDGDDYEIKYPHDTI